MSTHTVQAELEIRFTPIGCTETECATIPKVEIEFAYVPGYRATGPSYASGGEPGAGAEVDFIGARIIEPDPDGFDPTSEHLADCARAWLDDEYGYEKACRVAEDSQGPDPDAAYDAMRDERGD